MIFITCGLAFTLLTWQVMTRGPVEGFDLPLEQAIYQWARQQPKPVVLLMRFFSAYGRDGTALIALILAVGWVRRQARRELWMLFFGVLAGELWFQTISNLVKRARPEFKDPFETLIGPGYPSGHAVTNVLLGWMVLYLLLPHIHSTWKRILLIIAVILVVAEICFSRLFLGLHYPTDILGGLLLGFAWGGLIYTITDNYFWRRRG